MLSRDNDGTTNEREQEQKKRVSIRTDFKPRQDVSLFKPAPCRASPRRWLYRLTKPFDTLHIGMRISNSASSHRVETKRKLPE